MSLFDIILQKVKGTSRLRPRPRSHPRPVVRSQRRKKRIEELFPLVVIVLLVAALLWVCFAPGAGFWVLWHKYNLLDQKKQETALVQQEIDAIKKKNSALQKDPELLEKIAREQYNLTRQNEIIYDFSEKDPVKKK